MQLDLFADLHATLLGCGQEQLAAAAGEGGGPWAAKDDVQEVGCGAARAAGGQLAPQLGDPASGGPWHSARRLACRGRAGGCAAALPLSPTCLPCLPRHRSPPAQLKGTLLDHVLRGLKLLEGAHCLTDRLVRARRGGGLWAAARGGGASGARARRRCRLPVPARLLAGRAPTPCPPTPRPHLPLPQWHAVMRYIAFWYKGTRG